MCYTQTEAGKDKFVTNCAYPKESALKDLHGVSKGTQILYLQGNGISYIPEGSFQRFRHLEKLYLNYNKIKTVNKEAFQGLTNLKYLDLHGNVIDELQKGVFADLPNLETLDLHNNAVTVRY